MEMELSEICVCELNCSIGNVLAVSKMHRLLLDGDLKPD